MVKKNPPPCFRLTPRERDVVGRVVAGRTNREIAAEIGINQQAVKNILWTVYRKCQVRNRLELGLFAVRHNLLSNQDDSTVRKDMDQDPGNFSIT